MPRLTWLVHAEDWYIYEPLHSARSLGTHITARWSQLSHFLRALSPREYPQRKPLNRNTEAAASSFVNGIYMRDTSPHTHIDMCPLKVMLRLNGGEVVMSRRWTWESYLSLKMAHN